MTDIELGWLAGIIDGEGTIALSSVHKYDRTHTAYSTNVCVSSTSTKISDKVVALLKEMGLDPSVKQLLCLIF